MKDIIENQWIFRWTQGFPRSAKQQNELQQTDAEIIRLGQDGPLLALTMDSIAEEIETGLYRDPFLMGWMTVAVNASDLAAVGAEPLGLLINETLPADTESSFLQGLQEGIAQAAANCKLPVLGGDTNFARHTELGACAVGLLPHGSFLKRTGCRAGELLYASGPLGVGNAFAFARLQDKASNIDFLPQPRFKQAAVLRQFATCCMDSSDGLFATLDQLMRLNGLGFHIQAQPEDYLHPQAKALCRRYGLPFTSLLAGPHGEFELIFTVPSEREAAFRKQAERIGWQALRLGRVKESPGLEINLSEWTIRPDTTSLRNLFDQNRGQIERYIQQLTHYLSHLEKGEYHHEK